MATSNLRLTFGAMYIGCVISVSFSGMATLQAYLYFRQYRGKDSGRTRMTVLSLWILDFIHTVFICQGIWHYLVLNWGNVDELDHLTWTVALSIAITGLITAIVHGFFANRVWRLSKHNLYLTLIIYILAIVRLASAFTTTAQMLRLKHFSTFIRDFRWLFTLGLALSCIIDVVITGALCFYLQEGRTGYSSMDDVIHRLLLYTINNGLITSFASVLAMLCAATMPHNFLFLSLHFIIAKCYINSLLATLNSRESLKDRSDSHPMAVHLSVEGSSHQPRIFRRRTSQGVRSSVNMKELAQQGSTGQINGMANYSIGHICTIDNVKVRPKQDIFPSSMTLGPIRHSNDTKYSPSMSPTSTLSPVSPDYKPHAYPPSLPPLSSPPFTMTQVHINVEQTIHRDDGEVEFDLNHLENNKDTSDVESVGDVEEKDTCTLDTSHMA